jgi:hypothetical protein
MIRAFVFVGAGFMPARFNAGNHKGCPYNTNTNSNTNAGE